MGFEAHMKYYIFKVISQQNKKAPQRGASEQDGDENPEDGCGSEANRCCDSNPDHCLFHPGVSIAVFSSPEINDQAIA
ncbi:MAG: hypothetical protein JWN37_395 [Candidatus Nomurabacteria bacterium]|nr:hypothetical protein [Candidatus Nomurabacteria bacterium]